MFAPGARVMAVYANGEAYAATVAEAVTARPPGRALVGELAGGGDHVAAVRAVPDVGGMPEAHVPGHIQQHVGGQHP